MKSARWLAAGLFAVTMVMATGGWAQDSPPSPAPDQGPPEAQAPPQQQPGDSQAQPQDNPQVANTQNPQQDSADDQPPADANQPVPGQPSTSVARASFIRGDVTMQRGDSNDNAKVTLNTPLVPGDAIFTGDKSRAEVELDYANVLRLAAQTQVKIANLSRNQIQIQVGQGYASYSVYKGNEANVEIDSPNVSVRLLQPGRYRVQVNSDYETDVIVREGEAEVSTPQGSKTIKEGEVITVRGTDNPEYKVAAAPSHDDWDQWNTDRDRLILSANSRKQTNPYYTGAHDLDSYGRWENVPGYGNVWQPYDQGADWAPYQNGRWVWEPGWGWTWVSYEPWGWAPYHYGRWFWWNTGWVWWPGPVYPAYYPVWAPAYVSFFGFGGGWGFGFGFGSVGWLPCGPFDPFFPWFGFGFNHFTTVNIFVFNNRFFFGNRFVGGHFGGRFVGPLGVHGRNPVFSNVHMAMTNTRVRQGITSVSREDFVRGGIGSRHIGMDAGQLRNTHMMGGNLGVVPTHASLGTNVRENAGIQNRTSGRFFNRSTPAATQSFRAQTAQMEHLSQNASRTGGSANERFSGNTRFGNNPAGPRGGNNGGSAAARANSEPPHGGPSGAANGNEGGRQGWHSFGEGQNAAHGSGTVAGGKPALQMSKPVVTPRSYSPSSSYGQSGGSRGYGSSPSYGQSGGSRGYSPSPSYGQSGGSRGYSPSPSYGRSGGNYGSYGSSSPRGYGSYGGSNSRSYGSYGSRGGSSGSYGSRSGSYGGSRGGSYGGSHSGGGGGHSSGGSHSSGGGSHSGGHR